MQRELLFRDSAFWSAERILGPGIVVGQGPFRVWSYINLGARAPAVRLLGRRCGISFIWVWSMGQVYLAWWRLEYGLAAKRAGCAAGRADFGRSGVINLEL